MAEEQAAEAAPQTSSDAPVPEGEAAAESATPEALAAQGKWDQVTAEQVMDAKYPTVMIEKTIGDAYDIMEETKVTCLPIVQAGKVVRMITQNNINIIRSVFFDAPGAEERTSRLMCLPLSQVNQDQKLTSIKASENLKTVTGLMVKNNFHSVPVLNDNGEFLGMITSHKLLGLMA